MVYMSGGRNSRHQAAIIVRTNTCGGVKKAGLCPRATMSMRTQFNPNLAGSVNTMPLMCVPNRTIQVQQYGYRSTISGHLG
jgi:hypothetical protein